MLKIRHQSAAAARPLRGGISLAAVAVQRPRDQCEVETNSELTMGMTVADWWRFSGRKPNALSMRSVDADGFYLLLNQAMARLP